jgi:hemolysin III
VKKPQTNALPQRSLLEEIGNAVTHGVGAIFSIVALLLMLTVSPSATHTWSAVIYFFGLFVLFTMSCLYHAFPRKSAVKRLFRRFDYSSIYLLIGATFAPILLCQIGGSFGWIFFATQWLIIAVGITFIGVFGPNKWKKLHMSLYILLGWSGLLLLPALLNTNPALFFYILLGGVIYTLGIIPFALKKGCAHFIWHFFVLGGAVVQWLGIYLYIYL